jgi:hypothetical protein
VSDLHGAPHPPSSSGQRAPRAPCSTTQWPYRHRAAQRCGPRRSCSPAR